METSSFLAAVSDQDRRQLLQRCTRLRFAAGAFVFHAGEAGDSLHLIAKGKVVVLAGGGLGEALTLAIYGVGDVFGELALIGQDHHRITTIQALEATETLVLRRGDFEDLRGSHPSVDRFLVALLAAKVTRLTQQMVEFAEMPAAARVYRRLVDLGDLFNATTPGTAIPVTQDQLASLAGVKLRITNRVISDAKRDGLIEAGRRRLAVLNLPELRKRAQLDGRG